MRRKIPHVLCMILYVKRSCPWCIDAVDWLQRHGYTFEEVDVLSNREAYARMREISGQSLAPTLETDDGDILPDFDTKQLERFLVERHILPS